MPPPEKEDLYSKVGMGGIIRVNGDGTGREVYTRGMRNSVGHDFHPITGAMFPQKYRNAIFSAQHGSWNRSTPVGARVMVTVIAKDGTATTTPFAEGWIDARGAYLGRPVDVAQLPDGSLLVSDDKAGAIYRIRYDGK